jgi:hypothetical protein
VFAAHLLEALGIRWRLAASYWKRHAWVVATVNGVDYDLLDLRSGDAELQRASYKMFGRFFTRASHRPPFFHWRRAWLNRTGGDVEIGLVLGLLEIDSKPGDLRERFSTDWVHDVPNLAMTPTDHREAAAPFAAFPFGETLKPMLLAGASAAPAAPGVESDVKVPLGNATR